MERLARMVLLAMAVSCGTLLAGAQEAPSGRPLIVLGEFDGIIHPIAAEYLNHLLTEAESSAAAAAVIVLRTPGGLLDSTRTIVSRMIASPIPVVVFVSPSGARAASAGFFLTIAADVAVMAPGTHIGAAHPVSGTGEQMDKTLSDKAASDAAAYVRTLAAARNRNVELSEKAVLESRGFTDREALEASPPLIDFVASDLDDLLRRLDGRTIRRFDGQSMMLDTANAEVRRVGMTRRQRFLSAIAHPQIAYILMTLGLLGLSVELWSPGAVLPGVAGGVCLLMAFFAFQILPVSVTGLLLVLFGASLIIAELFVTSFGVLGIGGAIALFFGSIMLTGTVPGVRVGYEVIGPLVGSLVAIVLWLGRLGLRAQRQPHASGVERFVGEIGRARTTVTPEAPGQIDVHGEIWRAVSRVPLDPGQPVRVTEVNGLTLVVEPILPSMPAGGTSWS
jgi:membrane-bound serine protease (ClpP class)